MHGTVRRFVTVAGGRQCRPSKLLLAGVQFPCWASVYSNDDGPSGIMIKTDRRAQLDPLVVSSGSRVRIDGVRTWTMMLSN